MMLARMRMMSLGTPTPTPTMMVANSHVHSTISLGTAKKTMAMTAMATIAGSLFRGAASLGATT